MAGSNLHTGTLDMLVLQALHRGPRHGYAIGRWIRDTSAGALRVEEGALYPALHRLERRGWLSADWGMTDTGRQAKFYVLTREGARQLEAEVERWNEHADGVARVLAAGEE